MELSFRTAAVGAAAEEYRMHQGADYLKNKHLTPPKKKKQMGDYLHRMYVCLYQLMTAQLLTMP
jgi:hypothetical protein